MGKMSEKIVRILASLIEARDAGLTRNEWLTLMGMTANQWRGVQWYMRKNSIEYPMLKGMYRYHERRWKSKPPTAVKRAAKSAKSPAPPRKVAPIQTRFEIVVGA